MIGRVIHICSLQSRVVVAASLWDARRQRCKHLSATLRTAKRLQDCIGEPRKDRNTCLFMIHTPYLRLMKSVNERLTLSNMSRASSCVR
jgi:hypothetical protein